MKTILISALGCGPGLGSEQGVGWNWIMQMAKTNRLHVITITRRKEEIERAIPEKYRSNVTFHYYDVTKTVIRLLPPATILFYLQYTLWQIGIIPLIWKLKKEHKFDFSMHLTFGSIWMPTFLPLFNIPFIWGPLGGAEAVPKSFFKSMGGSFYDSTMQKVRYILIKSISYNPFMLFSISRSKIILARTKDTARAVPQKYQYKVRQILETAMEEFPSYTSNRDANKDGKIRLLSTGRLVPFKNHITAIRALSLLQKPYDLVYTIVGSGADKERLESETKRLGLENIVEFIPSVPREDILRMLNEYDIYLFPSLREGGSWALMEAMAMALPVVCVNSSGMSIITDEQSAIRLEVTDPDQMAKDMAKAIEELIENPEKRTQMGLAAQQRITNEFTWEAKGIFMDKLFNELS